MQDAAYGCQLSTDLTSHVQQDNIGRLQSPPWHAPNKLAWLESGCAGHPPPPPSLFFLLSFHTRMISRPGNELSRGRIWQSTSKSVASGYQMPKILASIGEGNCTSMRHPGCTRYIEESPGGQNALVTDLRQYRLRRHMHAPVQRLHWSVYMDLSEVNLQGTRCAKSRQRCKCNLPISQQHGRTVHEVARIEHAGKAGKATNTTCFSDCAYAATCNALQDPGRHAAEPSLTRARHLVRLDACKIPGELSQR